MMNSLASRRNGVVLGLCAIGLGAIMVAGCASGPASAASAVVAETIPAPTTARDDTAAEPTAAPTAASHDVAPDFTLERADGGGTFTLYEQLATGPVVLTIIDTGIG